jgi:hypothetical protein
MLKIAELRAAAGGETLWVNNALVELGKQRDHIKEYGMKGFFPRSIAKLQQFTAKLSTNMSTTKRRGGNNITPKSPEKKRRNTLQSSQFPLSKEA